MATDLVRIADVTGFSRNQIELIKDTIARGASDDELTLFLNLARRSRLDPFTRQIMLVERRQRGDDGKWVVTRQPMTGIDGLRLIADRTGDYAPGRAPTYEYDEAGRIFAATAYVMKFVRGQWFEVAATAHYAEYVQTKADGTPTRFWRDMPHIMLAKCAEALALRRAFPANLSGLYTTDEMRETEVGASYEPPVVTEAVVEHQPQRKTALPPPAPAPAPRNIAAYISLGKKLTTTYGYTRDDIVAHIGYVLPTSEGAVAMSDVDYDKLIADLKSLERTALKEGRGKQQDEGEQEDIPY